MYHIGKEVCQAIKEGWRELIPATGQERTIKTFEKGMPDLHHLLKKIFLDQRWDPASCYTGEAHAWFRMWVEGLGLAAWVGLKVRILSRALGFRLGLPRGRLRPLGDNRAEAGHFA